MAFCFCAPAVAGFCYFICCVPFACLTVCFYCLLLVYFVVSGFVMLILLRAGLLWVILEISCFVVFAVDLVCIYLCFAVCVDFLVLLLKLLLILFDVCLLYCFVGCGHYCLDLGCLGGGLWFWCFVYCDWIGLYYLICC